jgi:hypothetical protein
VSVKFLGVAVAASMAMAATFAHATTVQLQFFGPEFNPPDTITFVIGAGQAATPGGPDQTIGETTGITQGGWLDFYSDGETVSFEGGSNPVTLKASSPFYTLTGSGPFSLSFPVSTQGPDPVSETVELMRTDASSMGAGAGKARDLIITAVPDAVPEPATWAIMLSGLGGLGVVLRTRRQHRMA